jgi:hypothetical protein
LTWDAGSIPAASTIFILKQSNNSQPSHMNKLCLRATLVCLACALLNGFHVAKCGAQVVAGLAATRVATGLTQPLFVTAPPGDTRRLFIVCQTGQVRILDLQSGTLNGVAFLDLHSRLTSTSGE